MVFYTNGAKIADGLNGKTIIDIDRDAEKIVIPKGVCHSEYRLTLRGLKCMEIYDAAVLDECIGLPQKMIITGTEDCFSQRSNLFSRPGLRYIEMTKDNKYYSSKDGILYTKDGTVLLKCPRDRTEPVIIPEGVVEIEAEAFESCHIKSVKFPDTLRVIGAKAFFNCSDLEYVDFGKGIENIGDYKINKRIFESCFKLHDLKLPSQIKEIGAGVFRNCGIYSVELNDGLEKIGNGAFSYCMNIKDVTIPDSLTDTGENNFCNVDVIHTKHITKNFVKAFTSVMSPFGVVRKTICADIDGKTVYIPRSVSYMYEHLVQKILEENDEEHFGEMFSMAAYKDSEMETAVCAYANGERNYRLIKYLKDFDENIVQYLVKQMNSDLLIKYLQTGFASESSLRWMMGVLEEKDMENKSVIMAYILKEMNIQNSKTDKSFALN